MAIVAWRNAMRYGKAPPPVSIPSNFLVKDARTCCVPRSLPPLLADPGPYAALWRPRPSAATRRRRRRWRVWPVGVVVYLVCVWRYARDNEANGQTTIRETTPNRPAQSPSNHTHLQPPRLLRKQPPLLREIRVESHPKHQVVEGALLAFPAVLVAAAAAATVTVTVPRPLLLLRVRVLTLLGEAVNGLIGGFCFVCTSRANPSDTEPHQPTP